MDITKDEARILLTALEAYEGEPTTTGIMTTIISTVLLPKSMIGEREQLKNDTMEKSVKEVARRKEEVKPLRAKFEEIIEGLS